MFCDGIFRCPRVLLILWIFTSLAFAQAANASAGTGSAGESSCVSTIVSDASNPGCGPTESTPTTNPPKSAVILVNSNGDIGIGEELLELKLHSQILLLLLAILVGVFGGVIGLIVGMHTSKRSHQSQAVQAIATVNGVQIPVSRFLLHLRNAIAEGSNDTPELHQAILDDLIFSEAVAQDAERIGLLSDDRNAIRIEGAGENALEDLWFANYLTFHPVTEGDIRSDYDRQLKSGEVVQSVEEYKLSQIVVASEKEALEILDRLKCGAVFGNLAREKSLDLESALMEGVVGWVPPSQLASPIDQLVAALSVGQMSRPIQTQQGWLIVKVDDIKFLPAKSFEEMRQEISQRILRDRRREAVAGLLASTSIVKAQQHPSVHAAAAKKDMAPH